MADFFGAEPGPPTANSTPEKAKISSGRTRLFHHTSVVIVWLANLIRPRPPKAGNSWEVQFVVEQLSCKKISWTIIYKSGFMTMF